MTEYLSRTEANCPYLGLKHDPRTFLAYPTAGNHCFHCHIPAVPAFEHQARYCLSSKYVECVIHSWAESKTFPNQLRMVPRSKYRGGWKRWRSAIVAISILLIGLMIWLLLQAWLPAQTLLPNSGI